MSPLIELVVLVVRSYPGIFANPMVDVLYLVVLGLVAGQYSRVQSLEEKMYGRAKNKALYHTVVAVGLGLLGGLFASILLVLAGVSVTESGISYLLPIALVLYLFSPRFVCYSYAGGLVSLSYLLFGQPKVNVPAVMALVACLHLAEALLIRISGKSCATPLYIAHRDGQVVGGFGLQRFWPIPLIVLFLIKVPDISRIEGLIHLPDWWPLVKAPEVPGFGTPVFHMIPIVAALGYGDLAVSRDPAQKARSTSKNLFLFSVLLLGFSIAASRWHAFSWVAALFSPVAHELVIRVAVKEEFDGEPYYVARDRGVMVLDVLDGTPAQKAGIERGNVVCLVRGIEVSTREEMEVLLKEPGDVELAVKKDPYSGVLRRVVIKRQSSEPLGIITVPQIGDQPVVKPYSDGWLIQLFKKIAGKTA
ncbi:MAG TPA: PDZ domain-containing protein [Firmicutes bacterium]|nr:PDZ domain-containing protein [Candidatus Fermentithermobacillaceae bacterium]